MSGDSSPAAPAATEQAPAASHTPHFGANKGIKFNIQTGTQKWACVLQDRSSYERKRTERANSGDSIQTKSDDSA